MCLYPKRPGASGERRTCICSPWPEMVLPRGVPLVFRSFSCGGCEGSLWWPVATAILKIELNLSPAHRDEAGGLGFLSGSLAAFAGFVREHRPCAGGVADFVIYEGESPLQYQWEVAGLIAFLLVLIAGPPTFFVLRCSMRSRNQPASQRRRACQSPHSAGRSHMALGTPVKEDVGIDFWGS